MNSSEGRLFSDAAVQDRLVAAAKRIGLDHRIDQNGRMIYDANDPKALDADPAIAALDETLGSEWIALQIDSDEQLGEIRGDLNEASVRFVVEWDDEKIYVNLNRFGCPKKWEGHQV